MVSVCPDSVFTVGGAGAFCCWNVSSSHVLGLLGATVDSGSDWFGDVFFVWACGRSISIEIKFLELSLDRRLLSLDVGLSSDPLACMSRATIVSSFRIHSGSAP